MAIWVAFLRGINLGNRNIKMDELKAAFTSFGLTNVQTVLASGNVLFEADETPEAKQIKAMLEDRFGYGIAVILRSMEQIKALKDADYFDGESSGTDFKLYVTFASERIGNRLDDVQSVPNDFDVVFRGEDFILTKGHAQENGRYGESRSVLLNPRKDITLTDRNWNIIDRLLKKAETMAKT